MAFRKLSMTELDRIDQEAFRTQSRQPVVLILDNIRSALNVGSAFRTADAFAIESIALCGITATPPHKEILKTALGSAHAMSWQYFETTVQAVSYYQSLGYQIVAIEQAVPNTQLDKAAFSAPSARFAFIFGNEVDGVADEVLANCDSVIEIPQFGTKHSINVAVSVGIVLWEYARQNL
jgi:23S rRNA (guanosine2251-2'-O)-methyltransferase